MSLSQWLKEQEEGETSLDAVVSEDKSLEDYLGDIQERFENYSGEVGEFIIRIKEKGYDNEDPVKDQMENIINIHEDLKNQLWDILKEIGE
jgi:hypothetical protein